MKTFLKARWENIIMANYDIDASLSVPYLPSGLNWIFTTTKHLSTLLALSLQSQAFLVYQYHFTEDFRK